MHTHPKEVDEIIMEIELELLDRTGYLSENALAIIEQEVRKHNGNRRF
jgi:hypothetical protein